MLRVVVLTYSQNGFQRRLKDSPFYCGSGEQLLGNGILNLSTCAARGHPEVSPIGKDDSLRAGCLLLVLSRMSEFCVQSSSVSDGLGSTQHYVLCERL